MTIILKLPTRLIFLFLIVLVQKVTSQTTCSANFYRKLGIKTYSCVACPTSSTSAAGSTSILACFCTQAGYGQISGQCVLCSQSGMITWSTDASCTCPIGYTGTGTCTPCAIGYFKNTVGSTACTSCPAGSSSTTSAATACTPCAAGTYKESSSVGGACIMCPTSSTSVASSISILACFCTQAGYGQISGQCVLCSQSGMIKWSTDASCTCPMGYTGTGTCNPCAIGYYKNTVGSTECTSCPGGSSSTASAATACTPCAAGTYKESSSVGGACIMCALGMSSVEGSTICSGCQLNPYYIHPVDPNLCATCLENSFVNPTRRGCTCDSGYGYAGLQQTAVQCGGVGCTSCPSGGYVPANGSITTTPNNPATNVECWWIITGSLPSIRMESILPGTVDSLLLVTCKDPSCLNAVGYSAVVQQGVTYQYPGFYLKLTHYGVGTQDSTHGFVASFVSGFPAPCRQCEPGTYTLSGLCSSCLPGTYKTTVGSGLCTACPANTTSATGSINLTSCVCLTGHYAYTTGVECTFGCLANKTVLDGVCVCDRGFSVVGSTRDCTQCSAGTYNDVVGSSTCKQCPSYTSSTIISTALLDCKCLEGYTASQNGIACNACLAGTFKNASGTGPCLTCPSYGIETISISEMGSNKCHCERGWYGIGWSGNERFVECYPCRTGLYSATMGSAQCSVCPSFTTSLQQSDELIDCKCIKGYTAASDGMLCVACAEGTYKRTEGTATCTACPSFSSSAKGIQEWTDCECIAGYQNTNVAQSSLTCGGNGNCNCNSPPSIITDGDGNYTMNSDCWWLITGKNPYVTFSSFKIKARSAYMSISACSTPDCSSYNEVLANITGTYYPPLTYTTKQPYMRFHFTSDNTSTATGFTAAWSSSPIGLGSCKACAAGTYKNSSGLMNCTQCMQGTYKDSTGVGNCTDCPKGTYTTTTGSNVCGNCSTGTYKATPGTGVCTPCTAGTYAGIVKSEICTPCSAGTYSMATGAISCSLCPTRSSSASGSNTSTDCKCIAGFTALADGIACDACSVGKFKPMTGSTACTACPVFMTSLAGSNDVNNCTCIGGYTPAADSLGIITCNGCDGGKYFEAATLSCVSCPEGKTSVSRGQSVTDCICSVGYTSTFDGGACSMCSVGTYKITTGSGLCSACPPGTSSLSGSTLLTDCICMAGYRGVSNGFECYECWRGKYKETSGIGECQNCPFMTTTDTMASAFLTDCTCLQGSTAQSDGLACVHCAAGKYKPERGVGNCTSCPERTTSTQGRWEITQCTCLLPWVNDYMYEECRTSHKYQLGNMGLIDMVGSSLSHMGDNLHIIDLGQGRRPVQASLSNGATIVLFDNGDVVGFGSNFNGVLGTGMNVASTQSYYIGRTVNQMGNYLPLIRLSTLEKGKSLARGGTTSPCVVLTSNKIKCWGNNENGKLGLGDTITRGDEPNEMSDFLPFVDLGAKLPSSAGVGQQPMCIGCERASSWKTPSIVPNTALSVAHDAVNVIGDIRMSPRCMPSLIEGLFIHFTFDDSRLQNTAPNGPAMALVQFETYTVSQKNNSYDSKRILPGRVGNAYMQLNLRHAYRAGSDASPVLPAGTQRFTISGWLLHRTPYYNWIWQLAKANAIDPTQSWFYCSSSATFDLTCRVDNNKMFTINVTKSTWTHYTITLDGISGTYELYLDGVLYNTDSNPNWKIDSTAEWSSLALGSWYVPNGNSTMFSRVSIDEVRLYNRIISADEISALCPSEMQGLIFHAPYDTDAADYSGYGHVATPTGEPYSYELDGVVGRKYARTNDGVISGQNYSGTFDVASLVADKGFSYSFWLFAKKTRSTSPTWLTFFKDTNNQIQVCSTLFAGNPLIPATLRWTSIVSSSTDSKLICPGVISDSWKHVVVSINASSIMSTWLDGEAVDVKTLVGIPLGELQLITTTILTPSSNPVDDVLAELDDLRVYSRALSQLDVDLLYKKNNTMGGCYDQTACASAVKNDDEIPEDCWTGSQSKRIGSIVSPEPEIQSSFSFYCTEATNVSFSVRQDPDIHDVYTEPIRFKTDKNPEWSKEPEFLKDKIDLVILEDRPGEMDHMQYVTVDSTTGDVYMVHKFVHVRGRRAVAFDDQTPYRATFLKETIIDVLVVGGGGAGGGSGNTATGWGAGGGGSGGAYNLVKGLSVYGAYDIKVGAGGRGIGVKGSTSLFNGAGTSLTSIGGDFGGHVWYDVYTDTIMPCSSDAFGGGSGGYRLGSPGIRVRAGCVGQFSRNGNVIRGGDGQDRSPSSASGGGGGGCGGSGGNADYHITTANNGMGGLGLDFLGFGRGFCGGGSGAAEDCAARSASHGGGQSGPADTHQPDAIDGTGGGGGAGALGCQRTGNGGSGVVMFRYRIEPTIFWTTGPSMLALRGVSHILTVGVSAGSAPFSHVKFIEGAGVCYFNTDDDPNTAVCTQCPSGQELSQLNGGNICRPCLVGMVFDRVVKKCISCPPGSYTTGLGDDFWARCDLCAVGTFAPVERSTSCTSCASNSFADNRGMSSCTRCPFANMTTSAVKNTCACRTGFSFANRKECVKCSPGTFRSIQMPPESLCIPCSENSEVVEPERDRCACPYAYVSNISLANHTGGHILHDEQFYAYSQYEKCVPCPLFRCAANRYQYGIVACRNCPANSESEEGVYGISNCSCKAGFGKRVGADICELCPISSFSSKRAMQPCTLCKTGSVTVSTGSTNVSDCVCAPGFYGDGVQDKHCSACDDRSYKEGYGNNINCSSCSAMRISFAGASSRESCLCPAGFTASNPTSSTSTCVSCTNDKYSSYRGATCLTCPINSTSENTGNTDCECKAGLFMSGVTYQSYNSTRTSCDCDTRKSRCEPCPIGRYSGGIGNKCQPCPHTTTTERVGATSVRQCVCGPGTLLTSMTPDLIPTCTPCGNARMFQPLHHTNATIVCQECQADASSMSTNYAKCTCSRGFQADTNNVCNLCPLTSYGSAENVCSTCRYSSHSQGIATRLDCECQPGHTFLGHPNFNHSVNNCARCTAGTFKSPPGQLAGCSKCNAGTYSGYGSAVCTDCEPGSVSSPEAQVCEQCSAGKYAPNAITCLPCSTDTTRKWSPRGSTTCFTCKKNYIAFEDSCFCPSNYIPEFAGQNPQCKLSCLNTSAGCNSTCGNIVCERCQNNVGTHGVLGATSCSPCPRGFFTTDTTGCQSCVLGGTCQIGETPPDCKGNSTLLACVKCSLHIDAVALCFGYVQMLGDCRWECIPCNIGLIPDGLGGCRAAGRRSDSTAYEDDQGSVYDVNRTLLWYKTPEISVEHRRVLRVLSYGQRWTCGIEQIHDYLHTTNNTDHVLDGSGSDGTLRKTVSVDCRYETICALYFNMYDSNQGDTTEYTPTIKAQGDAVKCLNEEEWQLPWAATSIVSGSHHACAMLSDEYLSVYCWGSSEWGNVRETQNQSALPWRLNARKVVTSERTTCVVDRSFSGDEYGDVYCWGFTPAFFRNDFKLVTKVPQVVILDPDTYVRDLILIDRYSSPSIAGVINSNTEVSICMLLHNYMIMCYGANIHPYLSIPWRIAPHYQSFPTSISSGIVNGELCVVYNHFDELCWDVSQPPPENRANQSVYNDSAYEATLVDVMEPTLFYHRMPISPLQNVSNLFTTLQAAAFIYPKDINGGVCTFKIPYCTNSTSQDDFRSPVGNLNDRTEQYPLYPKKQIWYFLVNMSMVGDNQLLFLLPNLEPSAVYFHMYTTNEIAECNCDKISYLTLSPTNDRNELERVDISLTMQQLREQSSMFISMELSADLSHTSINIAVGSSGLLINRNTASEAYTATTFRVFHFKEQLDFLQRLPALDFTNPKIIWVSLCTGSYTDRWQPWASNTTITWDQSDKYLRLTKDPSFLTERLIIVAPTGSKQTGICPIHQYMTPNGCELCDGNTIKPIAHVSECILTQYATGSGNISKTLYVHRGFDGSLRIGPESDLSVRIAKCTDQMVPNPYKLDDSGNPRCDECPSLKCKPWQVETTTCDVGDGRRKCNTKAYPNTTACATWVDTSFNCVDIPKYIIIDTVKTIYNNISREYKREYQSTSLQMDILEARHVNTLISYAQLRSGLLPDSKYLIVSLGRNEDLLGWKRSINPSASFGVHWTNHTQLYDVCLGSLRIRFRFDEVEVSIQIGNPWPETKILAVRRISLNTFASNLAVSTGDGIRHIPLFYTKNVTISLKTHKTNEFALSTSTEMDSVILSTLGLDIDLGVSYTVIYEHIARSEYPSYFDDDAKTYRKEEFPFVFVGMALGVSGIYEIDTKDIRIEPRFLGASHFHRWVAPDDAVFASYSALSSLAFISPCFDTFVRCAEIKTQLVSWNKTEKPYEWTHGYASNISSPNDAVQRRRLLQADSGTQLPMEDPTYIYLNEQDFSMQEFTTPDKIENLHDFRFTTRIRIAPYIVTPTPGFIINNYNGSFPQTESNSSIVNTETTGWDLSVELVNENRVRLHICGITYVTEPIQPGDWHEFSFAVRDQLNLVVLHNNLAVWTERFPTAEQPVCTLRTNVINVGKSMHYITPYHYEGKSATGIELQFVFFNSNIPVISRSVFLEGILHSFYTENRPRPSVAWTDEFLGLMGNVVASYIRGVIRSAPVSTYVTTNEYQDVSIYIRVYTQFSTLYQDGLSIKEVINGINTALTRMAFPLLYMEDGVNRLSQTIVPLLGLTYERIPQTYCELGGLTNFVQSCLYDGLDLRPHSVTFNDRQVSVAYDDKTKTSVDFFMLDRFSILKSDLQVPFPPGTDVSTFVNYWGGGFDCELQFFVRTGPDMSGQFINMEILIPNQFGAVQSTSTPFMSVKINVPQNRNLARVTLSTGSFPILSFSLKLSTGFQHVRLVFPHTGIIEFFLDGVSAVRSSGSKTVRPHSGAIELRSSVLFFGDGFRELSNIHFAQGTTQVCTCTSPCEQDFYPAPNTGTCVACPNGTATVKSGIFFKLDCKCMAGFHRTNQSDAESCVADVIRPFSTYNVTESLLKGFCTPSASAPGQCVKQDIIDVPIADQIQGCSCEDNCVFADPVKNELPCCRNKCAVCPQNNPYWQLTLKNRKICNCQWDEYRRVSYNAARESNNDGLCSSYQCAPGQYVFEGNCVACSKGTYKVAVSDATECNLCEPCPKNQFRGGCDTGNPGECFSCTTCSNIGLSQSQECGTNTDTICVNTTECSGSGQLLHCGDGMYHAGCDKSVGEDGWCERCPVQAATDCPEGFFLDFLCSNTTTVSSVPNECIPCNRFSCSKHGQFPTRKECGNRTIAATMLRETISCSQDCSEPHGDEWLQRLCQYFIPKEDVYARRRR